MAINSSLVQTEVVKTGGLQTASISTKVRLAGFVHPSSPGAMADFRKHK